MEHHETKTAGSHRLSVHMIAAMFGANTKVAPATRKALVSRGLAVEAGSDVTLTEEGKRVREAMEAEVFDAPHTVAAEDVKAGTTIVHEDVTVEITEDARTYSTATKPGGKAVALNGRTTDGVLWEGTAVPGTLVYVQDEAPDPNADLCESCEAPAVFVVVNEREPWDQVFCAVHGADVPGAEPLHQDEAPDQSLAA